TDPLTTTRSGSAVVAGRVLLQNDAPGGAVVVTLERLDAQGLSLRARDILARAKMPATQGTNVRAVVSDATGRYAFPEVAQGTYAVSASTPDYLGGSVHVEVPATTTADTTLVDIHLVPTGTFSGSLTLENATTHGGSVAYIAGTSYLAVTDATGAWVMTGVPIGPHTITGMHENHLSKTTAGVLNAAGDSIGVSPMVL